MSKFKPMLFSTLMVQALLNGTKTQTRRIIKLRDNSLPDETSISHGIEIDKDGEWLEGKPEKVMDFSKTFPYWQEQKSKINIGDIIWVRETFGYTYNPREKLVFKADVCSPKYDKPITGWKPSLFMPKDVCRLFLEVTDVRIEQLQNISNEDSELEGIEFTDGVKCFKNYLSDTYFTGKNSAISSYKSLWAKINGLNSWDENPFVWVYTFKVVERPANFC